MTARQATSQSLKSIAGASLFVLGLVLLFSNLDGVSSFLTNFDGVSRYEAIGTLPALGLAVLHAVEAYTFDHEAFVSGFQQILVSFWPVILILTGALLLGHVFGVSFLGAPLRVLRQQESVDE
jgi:hypothetical protein